MASTDHDLIPFGKYKGQPVAVLQQDEDYCDWLVSQDWFRTRFTAIHTLIVNNFATAHDTPEHNRLQARFLDHEWQRRFLTARTSADIGQAIHRTYAKLLANRQACHAGLGQLLEQEQARDVIVEVDAEIARLRQQRDYQPTPEYRRNVDDTLRAAETHRADRIARAQTSKAEGLTKIQAGLARCQADIDLLGRVDPRALAWSTPRVEFEVRGRDVVIEACLQIVGFPDTDWQHLSVNKYAFAASLSEQDHYVALTGSVHYAVECKPTMGDDYPAVLRQMKAAESDTLVVDHYTGTGATLTQVRQMFHPRVVLTTEDVAATTPLPDLRHS